MPFVAELLITASVGLPEALIAGHFTHLVQASAAEGASQGFPYKFCLPLPRRGIPVLRDSMTRPYLPFDGCANLHSDDAERTLQNVLGILIEVTNARALTQSRAADRD
jgi:hypothetical protein